MICFTADVGPAARRRAAPGAAAAPALRDDLGPRPRRRVPITEDEPRTAFGEYGTGKAAIEALLWRETIAGGVPSVVLHPGHISGPAGPSSRRPGTSTPTCGGGWPTASRWRCPDLGLGVLHHVHADDVAQAFERALTRPAAIGASFHVVAEQAMTLRGLAAGVAAWFGREPVLDLVDWPEYERRAGAEHARRRGSTSGAASPRASTAPAPSSATRRATARSRRSARRCGGSWRAASRPQSRTASRELERAGRGPHRSRCDRVLVDLSQRTPSARVRSRTGSSPHEWSWSPSRALDDHIASRPWGVSEPSSSTSHVSPSSTMPTSTDSVRCIGAAAPGDISVKRTTTPPGRGLRAQRPRPSAPALRRRSGGHGRLSPHNSWKTAVPMSSVFGVGASERTTERPEGRGR